MCVRISVDFTHTDGRSPPPTLLYPTALRPPPQLRASLPAAPSCPVLCVYASGTALAKPRLQPTLQLRGGAVVGTPELFVKTSSIVMSISGAQMVIAPGKLVTDHFDVGASDITKFWVRGTAASVFASSRPSSRSWLKKLPVAIAHKLALGWIGAIGLLYPLNAKFGLVSNGLPTKYPMHYLPEALMAGLTAMGALAFGASDQRARRRSRTRWTPRSS